MAVSEAEFASVVHERQQSLLKLCYLLTGQSADAEDLLQDTLVRVYLALPGIRDARALDGYIRRAISRTHISRWRRFSRHRGVLDIDEVPQAALAGGSASFEDTDAMWQLLGTLGARQRAVVVLRFYQDLSLDQIAAELGISTGTVKSQLARALERLRTTSPTHFKEDVLT